MKSQKQPTEKQLTRAKALGVWIHKNWNFYQVQAAINWADPVYRTRRKEGHRRAMDRVIAGEGFLYIAEVIGTEIVKIGHTLDLANRVKSIRTDHGVAVKMIASIPAALTQERNLHWRLRKFRDRGPVRGCATEFYHRSVLGCEALPAALRSAA